MLHLLFILFTVVNNVSAYHLLVFEGVSGQLLLVFAVSSHRHGGMRPYAGQCVPDDEVSSNVPIHRLPPPEHHENARGFIKYR